MATSSTTSTRRSFLRQPLLELLDRFDELLALDRLQGVADGPHLKGLLGLLNCGDNMDRDVARFRVALQALQH
jgi:hypothetical protein